MELQTRKVAGYGWRPDLPDHRDRSYNLEETVLKAVQLPQVFSLRSEMPAIYDQGQLGSCTANGIGGILEHQQMRQGQGALTPSRLFIYYGERVIEGSVNEDSGAMIRDGIKVVAKLGAPPETDWPYNINRFTEKPPMRAYEDAKKHEAIEYLRVTPGSAGSPIRTPVFNHQPVVFGFSVPEKFEDPSWDPASQHLPLPGGREEMVGGHCTVVIGWDFSLKRFPVNVFEVRNSWGAGWGDAGHFWMDARWLYDPWLGLSSDFWVIRRMS